MQRAPLYPSFNTMKGKQRALESETQQTAKGVQIPPAPLDIVGQKIEYTPTGLVFRAPLDFEEWTALGKFLYMLTEAAQWWIGDWIAYGEHTYGETYAQMIEETGLSYQTLANYTYVSRNVAREQRREGLSWSHHALVAALPEAEQEAALDKAEREGLSCRELARQVGRGLPERFVLFEGMGRATEVIKALMYEVGKFAHDEVKITVERKGE